MKNLIAALTLALAAVGPCNAGPIENDIWVFGDSITDWHESWADQINSTFPVRIRNLATGGHTILNNEIPRYMRCIRGARAVYFLGSNDAALGYYMHLVEARFIDDMQTLAGRGCEVLVVLPPDGSEASSSQTFANAALRFDRVRDMITAVSANYSNVTLLDLSYDWGATVDGVHPTTGAHYWYGAAIAKALGLAMKGEDANE